MFYIFHVIWILRFRGLVCCLIWGIFKIEIHIQRTANIKSQPGVQKNGGIQIKGRKQETFQHPLRGSMVPSLQGLHECSCHCPHSPPLPSFSPLPWMHIQKCCSFQAAAAASPRAWGLICLPHTGVVWSPPLPSALLNLQTLTAHCAWRAQGKELFPAFQDTWRHIRDVLSPLCRGQGSAHSVGLVQSSCL